MIENRYSHICEDCESTSSDYDEVLVLGPAGSGIGCDSTTAVAEDMFEQDLCSCQDTSSASCCKMSNQSLLDHMYPTAKTAVIGKDVGEFELITSVNV